MISSVPVKGHSHRRKSLEIVARLDVKSDTSSPGTSPYLVSSKVKKRFPVDNTNREIRPITTKLEKPTTSGLDLPHIHVAPQQLQRQQQQQQHQHHHHHHQHQQPHLISSKLSRQLKLRGRVRRSSSISSLHDNHNKLNSNSTNTNNNNNINDDEDDLLKKVISRPATTTTSRTVPPKARVELSKPEKVPEPCRSCGRSDLPERFHTHGPNADHQGEITSSTQSTTYSSTHVATNTVRRIILHFADVYSLLPLNLTR